MLSGFMNVSSSKRLVSTMIQILERSVEVGRLREEVGEEEREFGMLMGGSDQSFNEEYVRGEC